MEPSTGFGSTNPVAEVATTDLPAATLARFGTDDAAQAALDAVLAAARRYCWWHVSPAITGDVVTLDGPGSRVLDLPTRKLTTLTSVVECGTSLDVSKLDWSEGGPNSAAAIRKHHGCRWSNRYRSIVVTMTHGFTETEAADWRQAIIEMVGSVSYEYVGSQDVAGGPLKMKRVDVVEYEWFTAAADHAIYSAASVLDSYRLPEVLFV